MASSCCCRTSCKRACASAWVVQPQHGLQLLHGCRPLFPGQRRLPRDTARHSVPAAAPRPSPAPVRVGRWQAAPPRPLIAPVLLHPTEVLQGRLPLASVVVLPAVAYHVASSCCCRTSCKRACASAWVGSSLSTACSCSVAAVQSSWPVPSAPRDTARHCAAAAPRPSPAPVRVGRWQAAPPRPYNCPRAPAPDGVLQRRLPLAASVLLARGIPRGQLLLLPDLVQAGLRLGMVGPASARLAAAPWPPPSLPWPAPSAPHDTARQCGAPAAPRPSPAPVRVGRWQAAPPRPYNCPTRLHPTEVLQRRLPLASVIAAGPWHTTRPVPAAAGPRASGPAPRHGSAPASARLAAARRPPPTLPQPAPSAPHDTARQCAEPRRSSSRTRVSSRWAGKQRLHVLIIAPTRLHPRKSSRAACHWPAS